MKVRMIAILLAAAACAGAAFADVSEVETESGVLRGFASALQPEVTVFEGIAFAAPPVGELRWRPPTEPIPFAGVKDADRIGPACWQARNSDASLYARGNLHRSEDCLYLNLYTSAADAGERLPVMVWYHGGGNTTGHAGARIFDGGNLAARGAVVITANYRLGPLGFFSHPALSGESTENSSGNYGLLDQLAALEWVRDNVAGFGGDPERVTIFGQSAGGTDVCLLQTSPLAEGLVDRVIGQSPVCIKLDRDLEQGHAAGNVYAENLGVTGSDDAEALARLRAIPAEQLIATPGAATGPVIDGWVVPDRPYDVFSSGGHNRIPVMVGGMSDEYYGLQHTAAPISEAELDSYLEGAFGGEAGAIKSLYPAALDLSPLDARKEVMGDNAFLLDTRMWARLAGSHGDPAYVYYFSRPAPVFRLYVHEDPDLTGNGGVRTFGAYHSGDLAYVFDNLDLVGLDWDDADRALAGTIAGYWVNFAATGDPNGPGLPEWPTYDPEADVVQILDSEVRAAVHPKKEQLEFLEELYLRGISR